MQERSIEIQNYDDKPLPHFMKVHLNENVLEDINDDESLPDFMKLHFEPRTSNKINGRNELEKVHETSKNNQVRNVVYLDSNITRTRTKRTLTEEERRTKNQATNRRHRANRYRYEVVRRLYYLFNVTQVNEILKAMNIYTVNTNIYHHVLFIALKNEEMVRQVDQLLHSRMFTKDHYERLMYKKK